MVQPPVPTMTRADAETVVAVIESYRKRRAARGEFFVVGLALVGSSVEDQYPP